MKHKYKDTKLAWSSAIAQEADRVFSFTAIRPTGTAMLTVGHYHVGVHPIMKIKLEKGKAITYK